MNGVELATEAVGLSASVIAFVLFLPQAMRIWAARADPRALAGVSRATQWFVLANASLWAVYAVLTGAFWIGAPGLINGPLAIAALVLLYRGRRHFDRDPGCTLCASGLEHQVFITEPPGWGSVMPCSEQTRNNGVVILDAIESAQLRRSKA